MRPFQLPFRTVRLFSALILSGIGTLILFLLWTSPLISFWDTGIPSSASNLESPAWRVGIAGDHLQLLYHFDLAADMMEGRIPWFTNPYEFNTGSDTDRFRPGGYFAPMSLIYGILRPALGQAASWNTVLWISVWASAVFAWMWLTSFTKEPLALLMGVLLLLAAPFRWGSLLGGSPAGIALMWVPFFLWRLDCGLRSPRIRDGFLIGLGLILLFFGDLQTFYLTALFAPVFALFTSGWHWTDIRDRFLNWWKLLPGGLLSLVAIAVFYRWRKSYLLSGSTMSEGRSWQELALFSPRPADLLTASPGPGETIYVGAFVFLLITLAAGVSLVLLLQKSKTVATACRLAGVGVLMAATIFGICLSLGTYGPAGGWAIRVARQTLPYFDMIRQSFKVFAIVPALLALLLTLGFGLALEQWKARSPKAVTAGMIFLSGVLLAGYARHVQATICLLPSPQGAYAAVAGDASSRGVSAPRILVIPLWPGDSAETSVPMHLAQQYHLRMVNGYSPVVSETYFNEVFRKFESINQGHLMPGQIAQLQEMGVEYLLVHADRFPEKVSPFPIRWTLERLYRHPELEPLQQSGPVHAFRIRAETEFSSGYPAERSETGLRIPARRFEAERLEGHPSGSILPETGTQGGNFIRLGKDAELKTLPARIAPDPDHHWYLRVRGNGSLTLKTLPATHPFHAPDTVLVESKNWDWIRVPFETAGNFDPCQLSVKVKEGEVDVDVIVLSGTANLLDLPEDGIRIPAADFFHAGYADLETGAVHFRPSHDPATVIWYGPLLPLAPGRYTFRLHARLEEDADVGGELRSGFHREAATHVMTVGDGSTEWTWDVPHSKLWRVEFLYNRSVPMELLELEIVPQSAEEPLH